MVKLEYVGFNFKNEIHDDTQVVTLSGTIGSSDWWDKDVITADMINDLLVESESPLVIRLNSPGGDVFAGIEIYNALKNSKRHVTVEVTALAASAASIIAMGADNLIMMIGSNLMIHEASTFVWGNKKEIQKVLNALESIDQSIIDIYRERTGKSEEELKELLAKETWFTAAQAVEHGFAHGVASTSVHEPVSNPQVENKKIKIFGGKV